MKRITALEEISKYLTNEYLVCNIGFPSRELYHVKDRIRNFYMIGSMGLASSIGLGLALSQKEKVIILDGDGSLLMNMGSLATIYSQSPKNLIWIVFDNAAYGSTGNQKTYAENIDLLEVAKSIGFKNVYQYDNNMSDLDFSHILNIEEGPVFLHFKIEAENAKVPIIDINPTEIRDRFMNEF